MSRWPGRSGASATGTRCAGRTGSTGSGRPGRTRCVGAAIHSVRAVPADQLATVAGWAYRQGAPLHVHLSEQRAENDACLDGARAYPDRAARRPRGARPGRHRRARHPPRPAPTWPCWRSTGTGVCFCPTTERDLADGIGPARALADAGIPLSLGSDSHAVIDLFEEARAVELDERLRTRATRALHRRRAARRGHRHRARRAGLGRRRADRRRRPRRPGHGPTGQPAYRRGAAGAGCSSRPPPPTSTRWWWTGGRWCATAGT